MNVLIKKGLTHTFYATKAITERICWRCEGVIIPGCWFLKAQWLHVRKNNYHIERHCQDCAREWVDVCTANLDQLACPPGSLCEVKHMTFPKGEF